MFLVLIYLINGSLYLLTGVTLIFFGGRDLQNVKYLLSGPLLLLLLFAFFFQFYWDIIDMQHCVSLKCITCPFDPFICCNVVADVIIFIPLDNYSTILSLVH